MYEKKPTEFKVCALPSCHELFESNIDRQRFHKAECRLEFVKLIQMGTCPHCGKELLGSGKD